MFEVVSLFSGCGGSSLGYKLAGFKVLLANEFIDSAKQTYRANFPQTMLLEDDIRKISGSRILDAIGKQSGELDLLDGSPPCSSFSMSGRREKNWGKIKNYSDGIMQRTDDLYFELIRILEELRPKVFLTENVPALTTGYSRGYFNEIFTRMRAAGYNVKASILNAKHYDVAQSRNRLFFMGVRKDLGLNPSFPPRHTTTLTVKDCLTNLVNERWELEEASYVMPWVIKWLRKMKPGQSASHVSPQKIGYNLVRLSFNAPAPTIVTISPDGRRALKSSNLDKRYGACHPLENRYLTISELKRISSFPDDFILKGNFLQQWERIARAVPPNLMKNVALHIKENVLSKL